MKKIMIPLLVLALLLFAGCAGRVRQAREPAGTQAPAPAEASGQDTLSSDIDDAAALTDDVDTSDMDQLDKDLDIQI